MSDAPAKRQPGMERLFKVGSINRKRENKKACKVRQDPGNFLKSEGSPDFFRKSVDISGYL